METQNQGKGKLFSAFVKATNELQNPVNSLENPYFNSKYVPLSDIIDLAKPVLNKYGLAFLQIPYVFYEIPQQGTREVAVVQVTTTLIHESGETLEFPPLVLKAVGNNPQAIGSAITYGRRYSLASILGLAGKEEDDDGNVALGDMSGQQVQPQYRQQPQNQSKQPERPKQPEVNVDTLKVKGIVKSKTEGTSGKGTPYVEVILEAEGKTLTCLAKDEKPFAIAKKLQEGKEYIFSIFAMQGLNFIRNIENIEIKEEGQKA